MVIVKRSKNSKGFALAIALSMMVLVAGLGVGALNYSGMQGVFWTNQTASTQAFWLADAGIQDGQAQISNISKTLQTNIQSAGTSFNIQTYITNPQQLLYDYLGSSWSNATLKVAPTLTGVSVTPNTSPGSYQETITLQTEASSLTPFQQNPYYSTTANTYTFYYTYAINSQGQIPDAINTNRNIQSSGSFSETLTAGNVDQYARLFLLSYNPNYNAVPDFFTHATVENGAIFSNSYFAFEGGPNPAGTFNGPVGQVKSQAGFYNNSYSNFIQPLCSNQNPPTSAFIPSWNNTTNYISGMYVVYPSVSQSGDDCNANFYIATSPSIGQEPDTSTTYWTPVSSDNIPATALAWNSSLNYSSGIDVVYNNNVYTALQANSGPPSPDTNSNWKLVSLSALPQFNDGFVRSAAPINLLSNTTTQAGMVSAVLGNQPQPQYNGVYVPSSGGVVSGGIFVQGETSIYLGSDSSNNPCNTATSTCYTFIDPSPQTPLSPLGTQTVTVDYSTNTTTITGVINPSKYPPTVIHPMCSGTGTFTPNGGGSSYGTCTLTGIPNGGQNVSEGYATLIYVNGSIGQGNYTSSGISGVVQEDTNLTVAAAGDVYITDDLSSTLNSQYQINGQSDLGIQYQCDPTQPASAPDNVNCTIATPSSALNLLGLISWQGNIGLTPYVPSNIVIQGFLVALLPPGTGSGVPNAGGHALGVFYSQEGAPLNSPDTIYILGGITSEYPETGYFPYAENITYDIRLQSGSVYSSYLPNTSSFTVTTGGGGTGSGGSGGSSPITPLTWKECPTSTPC